MNDIVTGATPHNTPGPMPSGQGQVGEQKGVLNGQQVKVIDQNSLMQDAFEELTSTASEEVEKDESEREVEDGNKAESLERVLKIREIQEYTKALGDLDKRDLMRGIKALLKRQGGSDGYREQARQDFQDPLHQFAALKGLVEALKSRGAPREQIEAAEAAVEGLRKEHGREIDAALNIGGITNSSAAAGLADHAELREAYKENSADYRDMATTLNDLSERFGDKKLPQAIGFMIKALGADINAGGSSIDKSKLATIVSDLQRLETLTTILGNADIVASRGRQRGASSSCTGEMLLRQLAPILDSKNARASQFTAICDMAGLTDHEARINFLTDLKALGDSIPVKAFQSPEARFNVLGSMQEAIDEAIQIEEDAEA
ncbi:MAG: type III secretion system gatekeeper subunit SctW [Pseudomonadota bacterium]